MDRNKSEFWKSPKQWLKEQKGPPQDLDQMIGRGRKLWKNDKEFEAFIAGIRARRKASAT